MPCWELRTQTLDMAKADATLFAAALATLGFTDSSINHLGVVTGRRGDITVELKDGKLTVTATTQGQIDSLIGEVRRGYTATAFKHVARRAGFAVQQQADGKLLATRRRY